LILVIRLKLSVVIGGEKVLEFNRELIKMVVELNNVKGINLPF